MTPSPASLFAAVVAALDPEALWPLGVLGLDMAAVGVALAAIRAALYPLPSRLFSEAREHHDSLALAPDSVTGAGLDTMRLWWAARESEALALEALDDAGDAERGAALARELEGRALGNPRESELLEAVATWKGKCRGLEAIVAEARGHLEAMAGDDMSDAATDHLSAALAALSRAPSPTVEPAVSVRDMSGDGSGPWRLFVGSYGVANWPSKPAREDPKSYAEEVARCVRAALGERQAAEPAVDLDAIEARARAATPGPWSWCGCGLCGLVWSKPLQEIAVCLKRYVDDPDVLLPDAEANGRFIAAARTDVPALCAELRRLRGERPSGEMGVTAGEEGR